MPEGVTLTPELANILREMARLYRANGWPSVSTQRETRFYPPDSIIFVNRSGEEIPAYGCMQVTGSIEQDGRTIFEVTKPDAATITSENQLLFNSSRPVADDENGLAQPPTIVKALKDSAETTDDVGKGWNYTDGEWYLSPSGSFTYYGVSDIDDDVIIVKSPSGGSAISYFVLAEDAAGMPVYAWDGLLDESSGTITADPDATEPFELFYWQNVLRSPKQAKAGYAGIYSRDNAGRDVFVGGTCIDGCQTDSTITPGTPPDGTVGTAYSHTVGVTGLSEDGISASGLPPGLAIDSETGAITGTPTTAGTYWVTLTGNSDDTPPCPLTRIVRIVIAESGGPTPDPNPDPPG